MPLILVHSNYQLTKYLSNKILKRHTFYCRSDSSKLIQRRPLELKLNPFTSEYSAQVYLSRLTTLVWTHLSSTYYLYENMASCCVTLQHNILFPKPKMNTFWNKFDNNLHYEYRDFGCTVASPSQSFECLKYLLLIFTMYYAFFIPHRAIYFYTHNFQGTLNSEVRCKKTRKEMEHLKDLLQKEIPFWHWEYFP